MATKQQSETYSQTIGEIVKALRIASGMTPEQLAASAQLSPSFIRKLEGGARGIRRDITLETARKLLSIHLPLDKICFTSGGRRRQDSVYRGLLALQQLAPPIVLIHDGARPYLSRELIERVVEDTRRYGASIPVQPALEATKLVGDSNLVLGDLPRSRVMLAQTPQGFHYTTLLAAYRRADGRQEREYYDDAEVFSAFAGPVHTIPGEAENRKITYPKDLYGPQVPYRPKDLDRTK